MTAKTNPTQKPRVALCTLGALFAIAVTGGGCSDTSRPQPKKAAEAAQIGDIVSVRYPASTIMCEQRNDASKVYITGELALRQSMRLNNHDVWKAIDDEKTARKAAMAQAYSCQWAPSRSEARYEVKAKEIVGDADAAFHTASYCLKPVKSSSDTCWWITATATMDSQIERISGVGALTAEQLKQHGRDQIDSK